MIFSCLITLWPKHCLRGKQVDCYGFRGGKSSLGLDWLLWRYGLIRDAVEETVQSETLLTTDQV